MIQINPTGLFKLFIISAQLQHCTQASGLTSVKFSFYAFLKKKNILVYIKTLEHYFILIICHF